MGDSEEKVSVSYKLENKNEPPWSILPAVLLSLYCGFTSFVSHGCLDLFVSAPFFSVNSNQFAC